MENTNLPSAIPEVNDANADTVAGFAAPTYSTESAAPAAVETAAPAAETPAEDTHTAAPTYSSAEMAVTAAPAASETPAVPEPELTKEEIKAIKKQKRKEFNINSALVGIMMILFAVIMNFLGGYINQIAMFVAIPEEVTAVFNDGGLRAVEDFYYNSYSDPEGKYYALSGITDNIGYCFFVLTYIIPFAIFALARGLRGKIFGPGTGFSAKFMFAACGIGMGLLYIWAYAYQIASEYITAVDLGYIFELFAESSNAAFASPLGAIFYALGTCVFAPLGEEFVCRGVILGSLKKYGNWWAIFITAALFGLMHMNFYQGPYALLIGMVLGYVTVKTGSIWCAVLIHMINNTWSVMGEMVYEYLPGLTGIYDVLSILVVFALIPLSVILLIVFGVQGKISLPGTGEPKKTKLRAKTLRFAISPLNFLYIAFCLLTCILLIIPQ